MDFLRRELLSSSTGLPLGILTAPTRFVEVSFLTSPDFRWGIQGLPKRKRFLLALFIIVCSLLALLAGPSSALLLFPQTYSDWPAGGATFSMVGTNDSMWPLQLDADSIGGANCQSPSESLVQMEMLNMTSCIWSGYSEILQFFQSSHFTTSYQTLLVRDGLVNRNVLLHWAADTMAFGPHVPTCLYAKSLAEIWYIAMINAPSTKTGTLKKFSNLRYRQIGGSTSSMKSQSPAVRTTCFVNTSVTFSDVVNEARVVHSRCFDKWM